MEVSGQEHIMRVLRNAVKTSNFSHAYIFCGPRGIGKTSVARIMAKAVNCKSAKDGNPCNKCDSCKSINDQTALDVIEIDAASNRGIDEIRDLREKVKFTPSELAFKVFIIDEVHMLTKEAFNALLKTLEEPPAHALFIMATTEIHKLPATVISRCQRFDFRRISEKDLIERVEKIAKDEKIKINKGAIKIVARASEGGLRDAVSFLDQISMNAGNKEITEQDVSELMGLVDTSSIDSLVKFIETKNAGEAIKILEEMIERGADIGQLTKGVMNEYRKKIQETLGDESTLSKYVYAVEVLSECNRNFRLSLYPQLALEVAILKIMSIERLGEEIKEKKAVEEVSETPKKSEEKEASKKGGTLERWNEVLFEIKSRNNSIHAFVRESEPTIVGDEVHLLFPYRFHKERIEDRKNKKIVEDAIMKILNQDYRVICELGKEKSTEEIKKGKTSPTIEEFLDVLGGEVVG